MDAPLTGKYRDGGNQHERMEPYGADAYTDPTKCDAAKHPEVEQVQILVNTDLRTAKDQLMAPKQINDEVQLPFVDGTTILEVFSESLMHPLLIVEQEVVVAGSPGVVASREP